MKNTMFAGVIAVFAAGSASAADLAGEVGTELTKNNLGNYVATPTIELSFGHKLEGATAFGGVDVEAVNSDIVVDGWHVGVAFGGTSVSFGDQGDLFSFGGLEVVGGDTLADPADDHESVIVGHGALDVLVGLTDIGADVGDIENVQLAYAKELGVVGVTGAVDYNLDTEAYILAVAVDYGVTDAIGAGVTATYDDANSVVAYEAMGTYGASDALVVSAFVNGDDADMAQNLGAGVVYTKEKLSAFAEVGYNLDAEEITPAVGVSFNF
jgi:hypothetical protein